MSETVVAGGGLAGAAVAAELARAGRRVQLLERSPEPRHQVCGEFLSIEAQESLARLGCDVQGLGPAYIDRVRILSGARAVEARLPFTALGVTRLRLDERLRERAAALGASVERGVTCRSWDGRSLATSRGDLRPQHFVLATGKHNLRGAPRETSRPSPYIGFKMYFRLPPAAREALQGAIEITLFDGGYAGLQLVEGGVANLCLVVNGARFADVGRSWEGLLPHLLAQPHLNARLGDAEPLLSQPLTVAGTPYGFLHRPEAGDETTGPYRVGDQAAVIPSFTGDGMAIALASGRIAGRAIVEGADPAWCAGAIASAVARPIRVAGLLQAVGERRWGKAAILALLHICPGVVAPLARLTRVRR